jgi:hypothetical protein
MMITLLLAVDICEPFVTWVCCLLFFSCGGGGGRGRGLLSLSFLRVLFTLNAMTCNSCFQGKNDYSFYFSSTFYLSLHPIHF